METPLVHKRYKANTDFDDIEERERYLAYIDTRLLELQKVEMLPEPTLEIKARNKSKFDD